MMILCIRDILEWIDNHPLQQYTLRVSYLEVYNEEINDLLGDGRNLRIVSEDAARGAVIGGLVEEVCLFVCLFIYLFNVFLFFIFYFFLFIY